MVERGRNDTAAVARRIAYQFPSNQAKLNAPLHAKRFRPLVDISAADSRETPLRCTRFIFIPFLRLSFSPLFNDRPLRGDLFPLLDYICVSVDVTVGTGNPPPVITQIIPSTYRVGTRAKITLLIHCAWKRRYVDSVIPKRTRDNPN